MCFPLRWLHGFSSCRSSGIGISNLAWFITRGYFCAPICLLSRWLLSCRMEKKRKRWRFLQVPIWLPLLPWQWWGCCWFWIVSRLFYLGMFSGMVPDWKCFGILILQAVFWWLVRSFAQYFWHRQKNLGQGWHFVSCLSWCSVLWLWPGVGQLLFWQVDF